MPWPMAEGQVLATEDRCEKGGQQPERAAHRDGDGLPGPAGQSVWLQSRSMSDGEIVVHESSTSNSTRQVTLSVTGSQAWLAR